MVSHEGSQWWDPFPFLKLCKQAVKTHVLDAPLEAILHPSGRRLVWLGIFAILAHSVFGWVWAVWLPQPFESLLLRFVFASLGLVVIYVGYRVDLRSRFALVVVGVLFWLEVPFFGSYMYFQNGRNSVWLASTVAMILIYHNLTDWRIATIGTFFALLAGGAIGTLFPNDVSHYTTSTNSDWRMDALVISFGWSIGAMLGISAASRQNDLLNQTLATMGIMAHELRTPLSSIGLIASSIQRVANQIQEKPNQERLRELSTRIEHLTTQMNQQINTQIINARLERLPTSGIPIWASALVEETLTNYPFKSTKESGCWRVHIVKDFCFVGPKDLMEQVISNLVKNAIAALRRANSSFDADALLITVLETNRKGFIVVQDKGIGIAPAILHTIFEPFFSTNQSTGHGLGLAFCKKVVVTCKGKLSVSSQPGQGACFTICLPIHNITD